MSKGTSSNTSNEKNTNVVPLHGRDTKIGKVEEFINIHWDFRYNTGNHKCEWQPKYNSNAWSELPYNHLLKLVELAGYANSDKLLKTVLGSYEYERAHDPIKNYFANLKWDGVERIDKLSEYVKAKGKYRFQTQFKKHLVRSIACSTEIGTMNKHCLVLIHKKQSSGKSSFLRWLCPPALRGYYQENLINNEKDDQRSMCENFIINLDEMGNLKRKQQETIKSMLSATSFKLRSHYATSFNTYQRIANFWGSTNSGDLLTDSQNVRWLCFEIDGIDFNYHNTRTGQKDFNIDDVWAEAFALYLESHKGNYNFEMTEEELEENEIANNEFRSLDLIDEILLKHFEPAYVNEPGAHFWNATEILEHLVKKDATAMGIARNSVYIGKNMRQLEFIYRANSGKRGYWLKLKKQGFGELFKIDSE